jgi:SAM-dependent methyltransferase
MTDDSALFKDRVRAGSFGGDAERYDRSRPTYPPVLIDDLLQAGAPSVLDVGCGTGIASRLFQARGCTVLGVEPDTRMAAVARRRGVTVEVSAFESWDPAGRVFDLLISGQAWHWIDPVAGAVQASRVLRPGGIFAVFWNSGRLSDEAKQAADSVYARLAPGLDEYSIALGNSHPERFALAEDGVRRSGAFVDAQLRSYEWQAPYSIDAWLDQLGTHSDHAGLGEARLGELLDGLRAALAGFDPLEVRYKTYAVTATRSG